MFNLEQLDYWQLEGGGEPVKARAFRQQLEGEMITGYDYQVNRHCVSQAGDTEKTETNNCVVATITLVR